MDYPTQKLGGKKRRRGLSVLLIFLFIPLFVAGYFLLALSSTALTAENVTSISLVRADGTIQQIEARETIALFMNAINGAGGITQSARPLSEYTAVALACTDSVTEQEYTLYLAQKERDCVLKNAHGELFAIGKEDTVRLLCDPLFDFLYLSAPSALEIRLSDRTLSAAASYDWHYLLPDGTERATQSSDGDTPTALSCTGAPTLSVPGEPDEVRLSVSYGGEKREGALTQFTAFLPAEPAEVAVTINANWSNPDADGYYGSATYNLTLQYTPEAVQ